MISNRIFITQTPYQLMTVLNIIVGDSGEEVKNLILLAHNSLKQYLQLCEKLKNTDVYFEESLCLNYKVTSVFRAHLKMVKNIFSLKKKCRNNDLFRIKVSQLFVPSEDVVCRVVYNRIKKKSPSVILSIYDDGNATYIGNTFRKLSKIGGIFYWFFLDLNYRNKIQSVYCYNPQLLNEFGQGLEKIKITFHDEVKMIMKKALNNKVDKYIGKKVVFLDQGIRDNENLNLCIKLLEKYFSKDEVLVKLHPRIESKIEYHFETIRDEIPFEIAASSLDFTDAIAITCYSGAGVMSIIMFGESSGKSVFLQKVCSRFDEKSSKLIDYINDVQRYYGKDKIFSPSTIDEFESYIKENRNINGVKDLIRNV